MRKDFTQELKTDEHHTHFIIKDVKTGLFLSWHSKNYYGDGAYLPSITHSSRSLTSIQFVKHFYGEGMSLNSYRELSNRTNTSFSFADDTPGNESIHSCYLAECDILDMRSKTINDEVYAPSLIALDDLHHKLSNSKSYPVVVQEGIAILLNDQSLSSKS